MSIVNFGIKRPLDEKIKKAINEYGFSSKAEFFRFAAIDFLNRDKKQISEEERFDYLVSELRRTLVKKLRNKKIPPLKKQLADI